MRCLVFGGCGFLGSHLVDALLADGHFVRCFSRNNDPLSAGRISHENFEFFEGDFRIKSDVAAALEDCDVVFHLACMTLPKSSNDDPIFDVQSNVVATIQMLELIRKSGPKRVIFVSSGGTVYGAPQYTPINEAHPTEPSCSYGIAKLAIEKYLELYNKLYGLDYRVLRLANPYGDRQRVASGQGAVAVFLSRALSNSQIEIWGDGTSVRDYIHIDDVVDALLKAMGDTGGEHLFNIGSGEGLSLLQVLGTIEEIIGYKTKRIYHPARQFDVPVNVLCIDRACKALNWRPRISFRDGVTRLAEWMTRQDTGFLALQSNRRDYRMIRGSSGSTARRKSPVPTLDFPVVPAE